MMLLQKRRVEYTRTSTPLGNTIGGSSSSFGPSSNISSNDIFLAGMHAIRTFFAPCSNLMALSTAISLKKFRFSAILCSRTFFCKIFYCVQRVFDIILYSIMHTRTRVRVYYWNERLKWYNFCRCGNLTVRIYLSAVRVFHILIEDWATQTESLVNKESFVCCAISRYWLLRSVNRLI